MIGRQWMLIRVPQGADMGTISLTVPTIKN